MAPTWTRQWPMVLSVFAVSLVGLGISAANRWWWVLVPSGLVFVAASMRLSWIFRVDGASRPHRRWRLVISSTIAAVGGLLVALWSLGASVNGSAFFGVWLLFIGVGHLVNEWRWSRRLRPVRGPVVAVLAAVAIGVSLSVMAGTGSGWVLLFAATGVLLLPVSLNLLTHDVLDLVDSRIRRRPVLVLSLLGSVVGWTAGVWALGALMDTRGYAVLAGLVVLLLVGAIASDTPADVLIIVTAVALAWSLAPRGVAVDPWARPEAGETVLVALGDSYMSGEGAKRFYNGTNNKGHNECRRAPTAYAALLVSLRDQPVPHDLAFLACSGARAAHIYRDPQHPGEPAREPTGGPVGGSGPAGAGSGLNQLAHLRWLAETASFKVQAVVVSIGGNDARFGEIGQACVGPGDCTEIGGKWLRHLEEVSASIGLAYQEIRGYVQMSAPVVVVPYPVPIRPTSCSWSTMTSQEHRFLYGYTDELNQVLRRAAADAGFYYLDDMATVLGDRRLRICDSGRPGVLGVNYIGLNSVSGQVEQSVNPVNWLHNSFHPNARGHEVMRDALHAWLMDTRHAIPLAAPAVKVGPPAIATMEQLMGDPDFRHCGNPASRIEHCDGTSNEWAAAQIAGIAGQGLLAVLPIVAAAWVFWLVLLVSFRNRRQAGRRDR